MTQKESMCSHPFKFVVVGERGSGKTTLIKRLLSDFRDGGAQEHLEETKPTFVCDGHTAVLNATVKHVRKDGSSIALKDGDIARQLWNKKYSKTKSIPSKFHLKPEYQRDISWDDIFVYLHKPPRRDRSVFRLGQIVPPSPTSPPPDTEKTSINSKILSGPQKPARSYIYTRGNDGEIVSTCTRKVSFAGPKPSDTEIMVDIWDTCGDRSLMWYRWYACTGADAVLLCVPLSSILRFDKTKCQGENNHSSEDNEISKSLQKFLSDEFLSDKTKRLDYRVPPVLLVGTKSDECEMVNEQRRSVFEIGEENAIDTIGLNLASEIGCCDFVYCSGLRGNGVASVFEAALAVSLTMSGKYRTSDPLPLGFESGQSDCESSLSREVASPTYFKVHSFPKKGKPESKPSQEKSMLSLDTEGSPAQGSDRPPPKIFFPPPPDSSPPSTRPNSSESSFDHTESLSSSESAVEVNGGRVELPLNSCKSGAIVFESYEKVPSATVSGVRTPTPVPRKRIQTDPSEASALPRAQAVSAKADTLPRDCRGTPIPRPRTNAHSRMRRHRQVDRSRRESVFVKFLQAK